MDFWQSASYRTGARPWRLSRRRLLSVIAAGGASAYLAACSSNNKPAASGAATQAAGAGTAAPGGTRAASAGAASPSASTQTAAQAHGGSIKLAYHNEPQYLSVRGSLSGYDPNFLMVNGDSLIYVKPDGTVDPANSLVSKYEFADPTTLVLSLRPNVQFHDGTNFDSAAVKGDFQFLTDKTKAKSFGYATILDPVAGIDTPDATTVKLTLKTPSPALVGGLGVQPGIPFSLTQVQKLGDDELLKPAGTGPYKVDSYTSGTGWSYVKNPSFWGPKDGTPFLDRIDFKVITDVNARAAALQNGDVDVAWFDDSYDATLTLSKDKTIAQAKFFAGPSVLSLNHSKPPLDNLKVRQALASAIDKAKVLQVINNGQGAVAAGGLLPPGTFGAIPYAPYPFDLTKAKQYLQASGVPTPVKLSLIFGGNGSDSSNPGALTAQIYQQTLNSVGFDVSLQNTPGNDQFNVMFQQGGAHLLIFSTGARPDPDGEFSLWVNQDSFYNAGRVSQDPAQLQINDLVLKARQEFDQNTRQQEYQQITKVMLDNVLVGIPIVDRVRWMFSRGKVVGTTFPGFVNTPAGASFRARMLSLGS